MVDIPKFSLKGAKIKTEAELNAKLAETKTGSKYLRPGVHDVTIASAEYQGKAKDDNWGKFLLTFKGLRDQTTTAMLLVPISDIEYRTADGKVTTFLYTKFRRFMEALGVAVTVENLEDTLNTYFANPSKALVGQNLTIKLDYDGNHVKYAGKDEAGKNRYVIQMKDGTQIAGADKKVLTFGDFDSAMAHVEANQITVQEYPSVLDYTASASGTKKSAGW